MKECLSHSVPQAQTHRISRAFAIGRLALLVIFATNLFADQAMGMPMPELRKRLQAFAARYNGQVFESNRPCAIHLTFKGDRLTLRNVLPSSKSVCDQETSVCDGTPRSYVCDQAVKDIYDTEFVNCHLGTYSKYWPLRRWQGDGLAA